MAPKRYPTHPSLLAQRKRRTRPKTEDQTAGLPGDSSFHFMGLAAEIRIIVYVYDVEQRTKVPARQQVSKVCKGAYTDEMLTTQSGLGWTSKLIHHEYYAILQDFAEKRGATVTLTVKNFNFARAIKIFDEFIEKPKAPAEDAGILPKLLIRLDFSENFSASQANYANRFARWIKHLRDGGLEDLDYETSGFHHLKELAKFLDTIMKAKWIRESEAFESLNQTLETWAVAALKASLGESHLIRFYEDTPWTVIHYGQDGDWVPDDESNEPEEEHAHDTFAEDAEVDEPSLEALADLNSGVPDLNYETFRRTGINLEDANKEACFADLFGKA